MLDRANLENSDLCLAEEDYPSLSVAFLFIFFFNITCKKRDASTIYTPCGVFPFKKLHSSIVIKLLRASGYTSAEKNNKDVCPQGHDSPFEETGCTSRIRNTNNQVPRGTGVSSKVRDQGGDHGSSGRGVGGLQSHLSDRH